jgi:hypothetical protein
MIGTAPWSYGEGDGRLHLPERFLFWWQHSRVGLARIRDQSGASTCSRNVWSWEELFFCASAGRRSHEFRGYMDIRLGPDYADLGGLVQLRAGVAGGCERDDVKPSAFLGRFPIEMFGLLGPLRQRSLPLCIGSPENVQQGSDVVKGVLEKCRGPGRSLSRETAQAGCLTLKRVNGDSCGRRWTPL